MDIIDMIKTKKAVEQFLEDLPVTNGIFTFFDTDRIVHVSLCECKKGSVINITIENKIEK